MKRGLRLIAWVVVLLPTIFAPCAYSWGPIGHQVTARFAEERLTARARAAVRELLGPDCRLEDVATWADEQKEIHGSERWHYVNVPISAPGYHAQFCPPGGCVVSKIKEFALLVRDRKAEKPERSRALKFLVHLVVDLHQPLHIGDNNDRGGNLLQVRFFNTGTNLHSVWDSKIMERYTSNKQVWLWDMTSLAHPSKAAEWAKGTPEDWASETLLVAKKVYCIPGTQKLIKPGTKLGDEYYRFAFPILKEQLAKAGIRLTWMLNELFK